MNETQQLDHAINLCRAKLRRIHGPDIVSLSDTAVEAMINTITINCLLSKADPGKVLLCAIEQLKTLDACADHVVGSQPTTNNKN